MVYKGWFFCCGNPKVYNGPKDGKTGREEEFLGDTPEMTTPKKV